MNLMKKDIESRMRDALRPVAPSEEFTRKLIAQVAAKPVAAGARQFWWLSGIAASLLVAVGAQQHVRAQRELADGLEARRQVMQALALTSQKLDLAYEAVKKQSSSLVDAESGA
jgi:ABC-type antimicrobial peptide transport system ATPase subunit